MEAELEDKEETTENEPSDPEPVREVSKLAKDAYPNIVDAIRETAEEKS